MRRLVSASFLESVKDSLFSALKKKKNTNSKCDLQEARSLHGLLVVDGVLHSHHPTPTHRDTQLLASLLVQVYSDWGCLREASLLSRSLRCSNIACNAVLRAHIDYALFSDAIHLFTHFVSALAFVPDNYTFPLVFKACSHLRSLEDAREVHRLILSHGFFNPNAHTYCALIDMLAKCGSLAEARQVFDEMPDCERDYACWTAIICGTIHLHQHPHQALREGVVLLSTMMLRGLRPDAPLVAAILPVCGRFHDAGTGMALQASAFKTGLHGDLFVVNAAIDMYCKLGDTHQAHTIFSTMPCRDHVSWRTLIAGYSHNSQYRRSLELYTEMMRSFGSVVIPSPMVMASVLPAIGKLELSEEGRTMHGFILKQGLDSDVIVGSAVIDMYAHCGLTRQIKILLRLWSDWDIMIWNSAIAGNAENFGMALSVFRKMMWESKFKPDSITLITILPICTKMGAHKQGMEIHCHAIRNGLDMDSVWVSNSLMDMYCKCGFLDLGLKVFDKIMVEKDVASYNTIISSYGFHGHAKQALLLFDEMKRLGMKPSGATFVGLISACSHAGLVDEGRALYHSMVVDYGIPPTVEHYSCMVDLLGRAGRVHDACNFIKTIPGEVDADVLGCLLAACRQHDKMDLVVDEEGLLRGEESGYYILISNMYASRKRWNDASRVRALIKEKGLRKKSGKSWMQIGHHTHVFEAGDITHSEFAEIQLVLIALFSEMKEPYPPVPIGPYPYPYPSCLHIPSF